MNIKELEAYVSKFKEVSFIERSAKVDEIEYHIIGMIWVENNLQLILLQYDNTYGESIEEKIKNSLGRSKIISTNRSELTRERRHKLHFLDTVDEIRIGQQTFKFSGMQYGYGYRKDWKITAMLSILLEKGWQPKSFTEYSIDEIMITTIDIKGEYGSIPNFQRDEEIKFCKGIDHVQGLVEMPMELTIGREYKEKIWFVDKSTKEKHWLQINNVYMYDAWAEQEKVYADPQLLKRFSKEELMKMQREHEVEFAEFCPRGMFFPVIEFEAEKDISLQFYNTSWLEAPTQEITSFSCTSYGIFLTREEEELGHGGTPLHADCITDTPMDKDTKKIQVELFFYHKVVDEKDIIFG